MAEEQELTGWERSRAAQKGYGGFYACLAIVTAILAGIWIGGHIFADPNSSPFGMNLWTEGIGMLVTVGLFGLINRLQSVYRQKRQIIDDAASTSNEIAKNAIHSLRRQGWLEGIDGLLQYADLRSANLCQADLRGSNLKGANLWSANLLQANLTQVNLIQAELTSSILREAYFKSANLQSAKLFNADLRKSDLYAANLQKADLRGALMHEANLSYADLREAQLYSTYLQGVNLSEANLQDIEFIESYFDEWTQLPDGNFWTPDTDITRFISSDHPNFWRSDDPASPSYRHKKTH